MGPSFRPRRSALYLPASNARAIVKARTLPCDVVILDLEDAVAPEAKAVARGAALAALAEGGFGARELVIRVNAATSEWGRDDLAAIAAADVRPDAVLLPKIGSADDLAAIGDIDVALWAMIETCAAIGRLDAIAGGHARLAAFVMGLNDLGLEMRARPGPDRAPFLPVIALAVAAARARGLAILDGVCNAIEDPARLAAECAQGRDFGCDGKTLIHPSQIDPANAAFGPSAAELAWAAEVEAAFADPANAGLGALQVRGGMVEALHREQARRLRALAAAIT